MTGRPLAKASKVWARRHRLPGGTQPLDAGGASHRLAFLSWLPPSWRSPYLRMMRRGEIYDCNPPRPSTLERMLADSHFAFENLFTRALREFLAIEGHRGGLASMAAALPDALLDRLAPFNPTLI